MSLIEELGSRLRASSAELPVGELAAALDKLRSGSALLAWVRQQSAHQIGVPELSGAIEHLEHAAHALLVAQDNVAGYLAAIGLGVDAAPPPGELPRPATEAPPVPEPAGGPGSAPRLGRWWAERVGFLTDGAAQDVPARNGSTSEDLLREVARRTRAGDRAGLREELAGVPAPVGLGLSAIGATVLHRLATQLLGHQPAPADLPALTRTAREPVRTLLPKLPPEMVDTLLARVCRVPPKESPDPPPHPADSAVTTGVLVGVLLQRVGGDADALAPRAADR
jgi:hypothetical protein